MKTITITKTRITSKFVFSNGEIIESSHFKDGKEISLTEKQYELMEDLAWEEFLNFE